MDTKTQVLGSRFATATLSPSHQLHLLHCSSIHCLPAGLLATGLWRIASPAVCTTTASITTTRVFHASSAARYWNASGTHNYSTICNKRTSDWGPSVHCATRSTLRGVQSSTYHTRSILIPTVLVVIGLQIRCLPLAQQSRLAPPDYIHVYCLARGSQPAARRPPTTPSSHFDHAIPEPPAPAEAAPDAAQEEHLPERPRGA